VINSGLATVQTGWFVPGGYRERGVHITEAGRRRKHVTISIDIFNDKGVLLIHSEQRNVRRNDLPLLMDHDADGVREEG